jgi:hypothetical protein
VFETGEFSVSVSSIAGCEGISIVNTQLVPKPEIVTSDDQTICRGEETIINAVVVGGSIPASFFWDQGLGEGDTQVVSPDTTTTYNVLVTDGLNCSENAETTVFVEPTPDNGIVLNAPAELMAEQDNAVYQWLDCDNNFAVIEGETEQIFNPTTSGNYAVEISLNDCIDTSDCLQVIISDVKDISSKGYRIYPVPTKDFVQISANVDIKGLPYRIYSLEGQLLVSAVLSDDGRISLEHYVPGMYLLEIDGALFKLVKM